MTTRFTWRRLSACAATAEDLNLQDLGTAPQRHTASRNLALDAVKGLLVLLMVVYHWLNYFVPVDGGVYKYLRFITPSFIFITGFLVTYLYRGRYRSNVGGLPRRLLVRGIKLLTLFTFLNLLANLVLRSNYDGTALGLSAFLVNAPSIYLTGDGRGAAFDVLVPIAYLLAASALLVRSKAVVRYILPAAWLSSVAGVYLLRWTHLQSANLELLSMGLLGMLIGCLDPAVIERAARPVAAWYGAYAIYLLAVSLYDVIYEVQAVGLVLNVALLYIVARKLGHTSLTARTVISLGQYSLLGYVVHIAVLQVFARTVPLPVVGGGASFMLLGATLVLTILAVAATDRLRSDSPAIDRLYRVVFA